MFAEEATEKSDRQKVAIKLIKIKKKKDGEKMPFWTRVCKLEKK